MPGNNEKGEEMPSMWLLLFRPRVYRERMEAYDSVMEAKLEAFKRESNIRLARDRIDWIREELRPERRVVLQMYLAQWEAHLDSLEDDGVHAIPKGQD